MHLRHGRRYCLGYRSDMSTEVAGNIAHASLYSRMTATLTQVQIRRYAGGRVLRCRALGAGGISSDSSEKCPRRYRRLRRRYIGGI